MFICEPLTPADLIEIIGIIVSLITSVVAIGISVQTLRQNSVMIEESTRPILWYILKPQIFLLQNSI